MANLFTSKPTVCKLESSGDDGDIGRLNKKWYAPIAHWALARIDRFVTLNDEAVEDLLKLGITRKRIVWIPNTVDCERFVPVSPEERKAAKARLGIPPEHKVLIAVGRLSREKLFSTFLKALEHLNDVPQWHAFILGEGPERTRLIETIADCRLNGKVTITSESLDMRKYLNASDIFVLASQREGISLALLEAMAIELACICTDVPGNIRVITHDNNGLLFSVGKHFELASAVDLLIKNEAQRSRLGRWSNVDRQLSLGYATPVRFRLQILSRARSLARWTIEAAGLIAAKKRRDRSKPGSSLRSRCLPSSCCRRLPAVVGRMGSRPLHLSRPHP